MGPILFNLFLNDILLFIKTSSLTNYPDDNTLIDFAKTSQEVISHLSEEGEVCLDWFSRNGMQANPTTFQLMMNDRKRTKLESEPTFTLQSITLEIEDSVKLLWIKIGRDITFKEHISIVCRKPGLQLSVLKRLSFILNTNVKMAALHSFIKSHLQYCPLVWANQSKRGMGSLEKLQERGLIFVYNNYTTPYVDLLRKAHIPSVYTAWQRSAVIEVYKALNGLSPITCNVCSH